MNMKLSMVKPGQTVTIALIRTDEPGLVRRLEAMGFKVGQQVKVLRKAWWNGPLHLRVGLTTEVAMRRHEAEKILVKGSRAGE
ncbi:MULTISPECIES: FeoA family protein [Nostoc]|uniref:Ferrous iron transport protein A n=2 Tax=Nostoc TaxID=1177 RepID=A0ABR8I4U7_9NOSO|nr:MULTISPECIES: FeoA family protein [Nostoc]MBD2560139.1 ferrous iron transport protein A [Nostoc linckia FACHB-391]MBD2645797.1 ferrous iron transport protein A [Nostoc foliaceum FACHB-393]